MKIEKVVIFGAGTMGYGLALAFAQGGLSVYLVDKSEAILRKAERLIRSSLLTLQSAGTITKGAPREIAQRIKTFVRTDEIPQDIPLVVEAIDEKEIAKKRLFQHIDQRFSPETIIASNTSYLNVFELAEIRNIDRLIITHWFSPPYILPVVEVVRGPRTSKATVDQVEGLLREMGKEPIIVGKYIPGFIVNRLQRAIGKEIFHLIDNEIISPQDLDRAVKYSLGIRIPVIGVVQRYDYAGLDFTLMAQKNDFISKEFNEKPSRTLEAMVDAGHLGIKSGKGFYDYGGKPKEAILRTRDTRLLKMTRFMKQLDVQDG